QLPFRHRHRDNDRDHEGERALDRARRRREGALAARGEFIGDEEDEQRPEIDREVEPSMLGWRRRGHGFGAARQLVESLAHRIFPAIMPAISSASKGRRSSIVSPIPIAWIGRPWRSAAATSTPPRAVPSSLVMTRPVTPATSRNTSIC